mmetsp:Transcript_2207/g.5206  ORF Transcript_2207/g.5206 Transcript_2207/m.5206 type:complete len:206 (+) Transcript_2207:824-1441(+)
MHQSRWAISSACCFLSCAIILSISSLTFEKVSSWARVVRSASSGAPVEAAACIKTPVARRRRSWFRVDSSNCRKEFTVLSKFAKASSSLRILMVSSTAEISSKRSFTRWSNSVSDSEHLAWRFARKVWSRFNWAVVSSFSLKASACFSFRVAISWSSSAVSFLPAVISSSLAVLRVAKLAAWSDSFVWSSLKSLSKSSFICWRTP